MCGTEFKQLARASPWRLYRHGRKCGTYKCCKKIRVAHRASVGKVDPSLCLTNTVSPYVQSVHSPDNFILPIQCTDLLAPIARLH